VKNRSTIAKRYFTVKQIGQKKQPFAGKETLREPFRIVKHPLTKAAVS